MGLPAGHCQALQPHQRGLPGAALLPKLALAQPGFVM